MVAPAIAALVARMGPALSQGAAAGARGSASGGGAMSSGVMDILSGLASGGGGGGGRGPSGVSGGGIFGQPTAEHGMKAGIGKVFDLPVIKKFKNALTGTVGAITKWSQAMVTSSQHLAQYNGTIAESLAKFEQSGMLRQFGSASTTAEGRESTMQAYSELLDEVQQFEDAFTNVANMGLTIANRMLVQAVIIAKAIPGMQDALDYLAEDKEAKDLPWIGFLNEINSGETTKADGVFFDRSREGR